MEQRQREDTPVLLTLLFIFFTRYHLQYSTAQYYTVLSTLPRLRLAFDPSCSLSMDGLTLSSSHGGLAHQQQWSKIPGPGRLSKKETAPFVFRSGPLTGDDPRRVHRSSISATIRPSRHLGARLGARERLPEGMYSTVQIGPTHLLAWLAIPSSSWLWHRTGPSSGGE